MDKNITGIVFDIQRFSIHDGPGIRSTVFMKGCPLSCRWCHNPEGLAPGPQVMRGGEICGKEYTPGELYKILIREKIFWDGGGGATFSGGEPLAQSGFVAETAKLLKNDGVSVVIDTAGAVEWERFGPLIGLADCFLYDLKHTDGDRHKRYCGAGSALILDNLRRLSGAGAEIIIRIPVIGGFNDDDFSIGEIRNFIGSLPHRHKTEIIPYHLLGKNKYELAGLEYRCDDKYYVSKERIEYIRGIFN